MSQRHRVKCSELGEGFYQVMAHYGFMETPDVPDVLKLLGRRKETGTPWRSSWEIPRSIWGEKRSSLRRAGKRAAAVDGNAAEGRRMGRWRKKLFILMTRNAQSATAYFNLPPNRVVELGAQIQF